MNCGLNKKNFTGKSHVPGVPGVPGVTEFQDFPSNCLDIDVD